MEKTVTITKETFKNEKGETIPYVSIRLNVLDKTFNLYPKSEYKQLFNYLIEAELSENGEAQ